jgi:hypothetical protein
MKRETFTKEGPTFSKALYVVVKKDGYKWRVELKFVRPPAEQKASR